MKRSTLLLVLVAAVVAATSPSCRQGDGHRSDKTRQIVLPAGEVHEGWYFAAGDQVTIDGTINGDAYVAGGTVDIGGTINGDLIVAGGQVTITGTVSDDIRGAGGAVRIGGHTGKNVTVAGGSVVIAREAIIGENLLAAGGDIQLRGSVGEEAKLAAGSVTLTGFVKGNVEAGVDQLTTLPGALVGGNLTVLAKDSTRISIAEGTVHGKATISYPEARMKHHFLGLSSGALWFKVLLTLSLLLTALALTFLFPNQLAAIGTKIVARPGQSALGGILVLIIAPFLMLILFLSVVGIPLGLLLLCFYLWFLYLSQLALGTVVGYKLFSFDGRHGWRLLGPIALGIVIVQLFTFIPYVSVLIVLAGLIFGVGALSLITKDEYELHRTR